MSLGREYLADHAYELSQADCVCGRCRWNRHDGKGFYCGNTYSENHTHYTEYTDSCDEWEGRSE